MDIKDMQKELLQDMITMFSKPLSVTVLQFSGLSSNYWDTYYLEKRERLWVFCSKEGLLLLTSSSLTDLLMNCIKTLKVDICYDGHLITDKTIHQDVVEILLSKSYKIAQYG